MIRAQNISKSFSNLEALKPLSFEISEGEFLSLVGPSGCGKSTLLRLIAGLDACTSGSLEISGERKLSYVFQDPQLLPWRSVLKNIELPLEFERISKAERIRRAEETLKLVGLSPFASRFPSQLSGGMKMRVSLARALVTKPSLLLLDEPFAALDEIGRQKLDEDLRRLWQKQNLTVIFVTHSIHEAAFLSNRAFVFSKRPGQIVLDRKLELPLERPLEIKTSKPYLDEISHLFQALQMGQA
jgi:NitT/TauT family transport system ATP-binding protein